MNVQSRKPKNACFTHHLQAEYLLPRLNVRYTFRNNWFEGNCASHVKHTQKGTKNIVLLFDN